MKHVVGVSDMKVSTSPEDIIVTHSLGPCVGIAVHDPSTGVGGLLHFQLPLANGKKDQPDFNPCMYADTGIPELFKTACGLGADKKRLVVKVAGGANIMDRNDFFRIGERNIIVLKKLLWKNGILISGEDTGKDIWRTMSLELGCGRVRIKNRVKEYDI